MSPKHLSQRLSEIRHELITHWPLDVSEIYLRAIDAKLAKLQREILLYGVRLSDEPEDSEPDDMEAGR